MMNPHSWKDRTSIREERERSRFQERERDKVEKGNGDRKNKWEEGFS